MSSTGVSSAFRSTEAQCCSNQLSVALKTRGTQNNGSSRGEVAMSRPVSKSSM